MPGTAATTGQLLGTLRNDYTGYVGEEFTTAANADQQSQVTNPAAPRAQWGNGSLAPNFDFAGTGGPPDGLLRLPQA